MKRSILKRPRALRDIEECFVYIGTENIEAALAFLNALEQGLEKLSEQPLIGAIREFDNQHTTGIRMWVVRGFENYEIFYLVHDDAVEVVRVLHAARDIPTIFGNE